MARIPSDISLASWIQQLIENDKIYLFYKSDDWIQLRDNVLKDAHYECQHCLKHGIYKRAEMVHHINEVRKRPDLALTRSFVDPITHDEIINLIALCNSCHEKVHDRCRNFRRENGAEKFQNEERW